MIWIFHHSDVGTHGRNFKGNDKPLFTRNHNVFHTKNNKATRERQSVRIVFSRLHANEHRIEADAGGVFSDEN